jgi:hypothetical protein
MYQQKHKYETAIFTKLSLLFYRNTKDLRLVIENILAGRDMSAIIRKFHPVTL